MQTYNRMKGKADMKQQESHEQGEERTVNLPSEEEISPKKEELFRHQGSFLEVLSVFTRLGLTSFGGPVAHLGYFREEFVNRRRWLDDASYADLVALCQFLPGPASSQGGIA